MNRLTQEQLNFKADTSSWSIAECVEHIAISENNLFGFAQMALKDPADPSKRNEVKMSGEAIVKMITDRSTRRKTTETFEPAGKFGTYEATFNEFKIRCVPNNPLYGRPHQTAFRSDRRNNEECKFSQKKEVVVIS